MNWIETNDIPIFLLLASDSVTNNPMSQKLAKKAQIVVCRVDSAGEWEFLLLKKRKGKYWEPAGGGIEKEDRKDRKKNEIPEAIARRELEQETGYTPKNLARLGTWGRTPASRRALFLAMVDNMGEPKLSEEHTRYVWLPGSDVNRLMKNEARFRTAIRLARKHVSDLHRKTPKLEVLKAA